MRWQSALVVVVLGVVDLPACSASPMPGNMLGTYKVAAASVTNTCGLSAPNPWAFDVQLSEQGTTLYWSWMDGSALLSGAEASSSATLTSEIEADVDATEAGAGPCTMLRIDNIQIALGTGTEPTSFTGTIGYAFSVVAGANCSDQLASAGGQYVALPCTITYGMTGTRQ
jgi:hypothetical protein